MSMMRMPSGSNEASSWLRTPVCLSAASTLFFWLLWAAVMIWWAKVREAESLLKILCPSAIKLSASFAERNKALT